MSSIPSSPFTPSTVLNPYTQQQIPVTLTDAIYWASKPPQLQSLRTNPSLDLAEALAAAGYQIDFPIMVWGWDPTVTMFERLQYGYTWVPAANQAPIPLPPGLTFPGIASYDPNDPPAGSIKVSVSAADYTPFLKPPPPVVVPTAGQLVGALSSDGVTYYGGPAAMLNSFTPAVVDGKIYEQNGVNYVAHVIREMMGYTVEFTLAPAGSQPTQ
jgi:hypothetical protein